MFSCLLLWQVPLLRFLLAKSLNILYFGDDSPGSTAQHRAMALMRLGHSVAVLNPCLFIKARSSLHAWIDYRVGYRTLQARIWAALKATLSATDFVPDLIWVNSGELIGARIIAWLKSRFGVPCLLYNSDDPTGVRDWSRFASLRQALPLYHLCVSPRYDAAHELLALGAPKVLRAWMAYDECVHASRCATDDVCVTFVGTHIPGEKRDQFLLQLIRAGIPLRLFGSRWQRSRHWKALRACLQGSFLVGEAYTQAIAGSALALGLLSHRNRDLHTIRSVEIPYAGGLLLAERTSEHQLLYEDGGEAIFWQSAQDCAALCRALLTQPERCAAIRSAGHHQVTRLGVGNQDLCRHILAAI